MPEVAHRCPQQVPSAQSATSSSSRHCPFPGLSPEWLLSPINGIHYLLHRFLLGPTSPEDLQAPHTWIQLKQSLSSAWVSLPPSFLKYLTTFIEFSPNPQNHLVVFLVSYGRNRSPLRPPPVGGEVCRKDSSQTPRVI